MVVLAGEILRTSDIAAPRVYVEKTTSQIKTNNTLADDNELFASMVTNSTYLFEATLFYTSASSETPDIKFAFTWPTGCTASWAAFGIDVASGSFVGSLKSTAWQETTISAAAQALGNTDSATVAAILKGKIKTTSTSGTLKLQFAQNTTTAENVTLLAGSHMIVEKVA